MAKEWLLLAYRLHGNQFLCFLRGFLLAFPLFVGRGFPFHKVRDAGGRGVYIVCLGLWLCGEVVWSGAQCRCNDALKENPMVNVLFVPFCFVWYG